MTTPRPKRLPPLATVLSYLDAINRNDLEGLMALSADDYTLTVLDEPPQSGKARMTEAWRGYMAAYPNYVIYPHRMAAAGDKVAILGHTTGSHLGLADEAEARLLLIWLAVVRDGLVASWTILEDTPAKRARLGLEAV